MHSYDLLTPGPAWYAATTKHKVSSKLTVQCQSHTKDGSVGGVSLRCPHPFVGKDLPIASDHALMTSLTMRGRGEFNSKPEKSLFG